MRRSRPRKKIINIRQSGGWNNTGAASSGPSYESFTIPTPRGFPSKEVTTPGNDTMDMSFTGRKRPASDAEHVQESPSSGPLLQIERSDNNEGDFAGQHSLDGGLGSTRPGVKQIVVRLSGLRQSAATSGQLLSVNHGGEPVKHMGTETEFHRAVWSNATDCSETGQNCSHPDFQSSQHVKPTVRILHQALQISEEREPKEEPAETQKEDKPGPPVYGENSGGSLENLAPIDKSRCVLESRDEQARSGLPGHDLPGRSCFPHPADPSWMPNANVCRSCPGITFSTNSQAASGCNACVGSTRLTASGCSFQRGVPRAVRYYVEPASLNDVKCFPRRTEAPACCQRMDFEGPVMYASQAMKQPGVDLRGRNLVQPSQGHTCGTTHYISGDDHVLVCPAPWVHKGRPFPGVPAMCVDQKYENQVNWSPPESEGQPKPNEESSLRKMPDPVFPPAHHTPNFSVDLDMDTQRQLEEQIAHEILLLSQKLANLQARYGARRVVHDNTKPAVLSCPQTPLLLDNPNTERDVKCSTARAPSMNEDTSQQRPATSSSSRSANHRQPDSRCQVEERKPGGRYIGTNTKGAPSIISGRGSESVTTGTLNKNHPNSRGSFGPGNSTVIAAAAQLVQRCGKVLRETAQAGKPSNKSRAFTRKGRELVDECSYSDDLKEHSRTGGATVQGYPDGYKRFDWVKTLRFGGVSVRENQGCADSTSQMDSKPSSPRKEFTDVDAETWLRDTSEHEVTPTSMSKSVQAGGINSPEGRDDTCPVEIDDSETRPKRRPDSSIGKPVCKQAGSPEEMGGLDSRLAHHLVKAGLRRAPSCWRVPGIRPVPNANLKPRKKTFGSRSPRRDGGKRLRRRTLFDPKSNPPEVAPEQKVEENVSQQCELKVEPTDETTECAMIGDYEAEYETFVENTSHNNNLDSEEYTSVVNREALTSQEDGQTKRRSPSSCQEKAWLSEVPVVSLTKQPLHQATKKTFIRCIELVVATKKKNQFLSKLNGRKDSGYNSHRRIVDCSERPSVGMERDRTRVIEGVACQDDTQVAEEQSIKKPKQSPESSSAMALKETQGLQEKEFENSIVFEDSFPTAMHQATGEGDEHKAVAPFSKLADPDCVVEQVSSLPCILSRVMPKQMEAEQLQARWEEIFDALEKERLGLPKIKTGGRKIGMTTRTNSPCDSKGCEANCCTVE